MKKKVLLIGLDGATFSLLDPFMADGTMPFLKELADSGARGELLSVVPPLTPPAWTSLVTGRSPGHHGIFDFFLKEEGSPHIRFASSQDVRSETVWSIASRQGRRVTTLNFPLMLPPPTVNGNVISGGWMTPRQLRVGCHPEDLYDRLKALPGFNPRELAFNMASEEKALEGCRQEEYEEWIAGHIRREKQWGTILTHLMKEDPAELTAVLFDGFDKIQHLCWRFLDPRYAGAGASEWEEKVREAALAYYATMDRIIGELVARTDAETTVILASDHGFGAQEETFFINSWLEKQGYLAWADEEPPSESEEATLGIGQLARHVYMLNWDRTKVYASTPSSGGVHIVTTEENPHGVPPERYVAFRDRLVGELKAVPSLVGEEPIVKRIWTREEAFEGPYSGRAPDLTLELRDGGLMSILASSKPIKKRAEPSGTHRPEGVLFVKGPGVSPGREAPPLSILNVAPLMLYALGIDVPEDMEGKVPEQIYEAGHLAERPVRVNGRARDLGDEGGEDEEDDMIFDADAEAEMAARLRALGYIE